MAGKRETAPVFRHSGMGLGAVILLAGRHSTHLKIAVDHLHLFLARPEPRVGHARSLGKGN